ncbi:MAG: COX15/CtaA family protein [Planctomycetes bacterium]|nr:COX15/CtaA family protein [Planctomycetota bacterium]
MSHDNPPPGAAPSPPGGDRLARRLTLAVVVTTLVVIVAGANVTTTRSGDAIPTWPFGWFTSAVDVIIEMSHRFVAGLLVACAIALVVVARRTHDGGLRRVAWATFIIVVVQAALGGVRVLIGAENEQSSWLPLFKVVHATLGQLFFLLAVSAAAFTSDWWRETKVRPLDDAGLAMLRGSGLALLFMVIQLVLGAVGRHDLLPREVHAVFALIPMILAARLVLIASSDLPRDVELFRGPTAALGFLTALQLAIGIGSYIVTSEEPDATKRGLSQVITLNAHVGISALMMGVVVSVILRSVRLWGVPTDERVAEAKRLHAVETQ